MLCRIFFIDRNSKILHINRFMISSPFGDRSSICGECRIENYSSSLEAEYVVLGRDTIALARIIGAISFRTIICDMVPCLIDAAWE
jgi:hypothetical protein